MIRSGIVPRACVVWCGVAATRRRALKDSWAARGDWLFALARAVAGMYLEGCRFWSDCDFVIASTVILLSSSSSGILGGFFSQVVWLGVRELGFGPKAVGSRRWLALMVVLACLCCAVPA
jgi:hypothetical protein